MREAAERLDVVLAIALAIVFASSVFSAPSTAISTNLVAPSPSRTSILATSMHNWRSAVSNKL
jgi:hypothetical protein